MQTVTSNTTQQINSALFALDRNIKNIEGNMDLQTQILTEAQTRSNADTALTNSINNVASELSQAQLTAYAYGESGSAATDVTQVITISGATSYNAAAGSRVLVSFPNGYTPSNEDSELLLQIGNMAALPALAQGVAMKYGSVSAGAMIEFTYTGSAWCCQSNIVKATSDYTLYADGYTYIRTSLVYSNTGIEVYRQAGTYTFNFRGCSLLAYQTAVGIVLNNQPLSHPWSAFISRRDSANNNIFPGTVVVTTDLSTNGWYSNSSGVETQMSMSDTLYGSAIIIVAE